MPLGVATNADGVVPPTITYLPDEADALIEALPASTGLVLPAGVSVQAESTNSSQTVLLFVSQSTPAAVAAATRLALGLAPGGNSPQPLDSVGACIRPGAGLLGWWCAEGNPNDSAGTNNATTPNGISYVSGKVGQAFSFNGSQSVKVPYASGLMTMGFTFELWVKPAQQLSSQAFVFGQAYGRQLVLQPASGGVVNAAFYVTTTNGSFVGITPAPIPVAAWTHLAATYDAANLKLYTNGVLARTSAYSAPLGDSSCPWGIGGLISACGYSGQYLPSSSLIDEVSLYNRALLAGEINAIYLAGTAGKCKTPQPCACTPTNAVASWPGEGDASDMCNSYPGTLQNGVGFDQGVVARAFNFNPTNQQAVEMPSLSSVLTSPFSLEAWIKPLSQLGGSPRQAFILGQSYGSQLVVTNGLLGLRVGFALATNRTTFHELVSSGDIPLGEWTHVAGVYDGTAMSLYVNGALDQQAAANITPWDSGCPFHLGGIYDPSGTCAYTGQFFNGLIDEATVYSAALSASDVQALYNAGESGKCYSLGYWLDYYFGINCWNKTYATAYADADGDGVPNIQEYWNHTDPNKITFSISVTNQYVTTTSVPVQVNVVTGVPSYYGLLVNDSNPSHACWLPFTTSMVWVPTPTNGSYVITVGLCGLAPTATQTWQTVTVFRETTPLTLTLTNLANFSGPRPIIDVGGNAGRALSSLTWTLVDANGNTNTGSGAVVAQGWNLADPFHTTTWFQCLDLALAPGANAISLQAADWAGNLAVTNFSYIFDTNAAPAAPVLKLIWPQNQTRVSPDAFTLQAWTDDDTASLALQYTDANGMVQIVNGTVERGGNVWVPGVALPGGTNLLSLAATNAAGSGTATNFTVIQGGVGLTVYPLSPSSLPSGYVTVIVSVGASASSVTVNGAHGTSSDGLTWQVDNVPLAPGGTVALQATAQLTGGPACQTLLTQERDPIVFTQRYGYTLDYSMVDWTAEETNSSTTVHIDFEWQRGAGGTNTETISTVYFNDNPSETTVTVTTWPPDNGYFPTLSGQQVINNYQGDQLIGSSTTTVDPPAVESMEDSKSAGTWPENFDVNWTESSSREVRLFTGGDAKRQNQGLFDLSAPLNFETCLSPDVPDWWFVFETGGFLSPTDPPTPVPFQQIILSGLGRLGNDGHLWKVEPDGVELTITPTITSALSAFSGVTFLALTPGSTAASAEGPLPPEAKYRLRIYLGEQDVTDTNVNALVGQRLVLTSQLAPDGAPPITNYQWTVPATALTNFYVSPDPLQTNGYPVPLTQKTTNTVRFCWVDPGTKLVSCAVTAIGNTWSAKTWFQVKRPNATLTATIQADVEVDNDVLRFQNNFIAGITFMARDEDTDGDWQYFQTGHQLYRYQDGQTGKWSRGEGTGLDTSYPGIDRDAPSTELPAGGTTTTADGSFTTYLAFRPTSADVLVPIRQIHWSWEGEALTNSSGIWTLGYGTANVDHVDFPAPSTISWTNNIMSTLTNVVPEK